MSVPCAEFEHYASFRMTENISWWDSDSSATMVLSTPELDRTLWSDYLAGAERVISVTACRPRSTWRPYATARTRRCSGRLSTTGARHRWGAGQGTAHRRRRFPRRRGVGGPSGSAHGAQDDRRPHPVRHPGDEVRPTTDARDRARSVSTALARSGFHAMELMGSTCMATSAPHVLERWGRPVVWLPTSLPLRTRMSATVRR